MMVEAGRERGETKRKKRRVLEGAGEMRGEGDVPRKEESPRNTPQDLAGDDHPQTGFVGPRTARSLAEKGSAEERARGDAGRST